MRRCRSRWTAEPLPRRQIHSEGLKQQPKAIKVAQDQQSHDGLWQHAWRQWRHSLHWLTEYIRNKTNEIVLKLLTACCDRYFQVFHKSRQWNHHLIFTDACVSGTRKYLTKKLQFVQFENMIFDSLTSWQVDSRQGKILERREMARTFGRAPLPPKRRQQPNQNINTKIVNILRQNASLVEHMYSHSMRQPIPQWRNKNVSGPLSFPQSNLMFTNWNPRERSPKKNHTQKKSFVKLEEKTTRKKNE